MLNNTKHLYNIVDFDNNRYNIVTQLTMATTVHEIIDNVALARKLLDADSFIQNQVGLVFNKSYYRVVLEDLTKNKNLWKKSHYLSERDFFVIVYNLYQPDRLTFIKNIGYENLCYLEELWQIQNTAKLFSAGDAKCFLHDDFFKTKFSLQDMLGVFKALNQPISDQWQYVQSCLGIERARHIFNVLDNDDSPYQGRGFIIDDRSLLSLEKPQDLVSLKALRCRTIAELVSLLKDKRPDQQSLIVELFGGLKEIKRVLNNENCRKTNSHSHALSEQKMSLNKLMKSLPMDTRLELIGFPSSERPIMDQFNTYVKKNNEMHEEIAYRNKTEAARVLGSRL
jgi:hypothetical protein